MWKIFLALSFSNAKLVLAQSLQNLVDRQKSIYCVGQFQICTILKRHNDIQHAERLLRTMLKPDNSIHYAHQRVSHLGSSLLPRGFVISWFKTPKRRTIIHGYC